MTTPAHREQLGCKCLSEDDSSWHSNQCWIRQVAALRQLLDNAQTANGILRQQLEAKDTVPRSRYDACNQDWLDQVKKTADTQEAARIEIERLTAKVEALEDEDRAHEYIQQLEQQVHDLTARLREVEEERDEAVRMVEGVMSELKLERRQLADRDAQLAALTAELEEAWVDEHQTAWRRPTAWAYAQVCRTMHEQEEQLATVTQERDNKQKMLDGLIHDYCDLERAIEALGIKLTDDYGALDPSEELSKFVADLQSQITQLDQQLTHLQTVGTAQGEKHAD